MKKIYSVVILSLVVLFNSCIKVDVTPTQLKMQVIDNQGYVAPGATVYLYQTESDFVSGNNLVTKGTTDANGYIYFTNLSTQIDYYFFVQYGCQDNYNNFNHLSSYLDANAVNSIGQVAVSSVGSIKVISNSFYPFKVLVDNQIYVSSLASNTNATFDEMPAGTHTVEVIQLSGYTGLPKDLIFPITVKCGATTVVSFP